MGRWSRHVAEGSNSNSMPQLHQAGYLHQTSLTTPRQVINCLSSSGAVRIRSHMTRPASISLKVRHRKSKCKSRLIMDSRLQLMRMRRQLIDTRINWTSKMLWTRCLCNRTHPTGSNRVGTSTPLRRLRAILKERERQMRCPLIAKVVYRVKAIKWATQDRSNREWQRRIHTTWNQSQ